MEVYLIDIKTNEVKQTYKNVIRFGYNYVEFDNGGRCKLYCDPEKEFFTDTIESEVKEDVVQ